MDFGDTLHELLELAGVKQAHLAEFLGYDVSYINKWISGQKRPSLRNNQELFDKIAAFLIRNAGESFVQNVAYRYGFTSYTDMQQAAKQISELLSQAYSPSLVKREEPQFNNSHFGTMTENYTLNIDQLTEAIKREVERADGNSLEFISYPLLSYCGGSDAKTAWAKYEDMLPPGKYIHVRFGSDFKNNEHLPDICHDVFIFLYGFDEKVIFDIYHTDAFSPLNQGIYVCRNAVLTISYFDVLMRNDSVIWTHDPRIVSMYYSSADRHIGQCRRLIMRECFDSLYSRKYFRKFFFAGAAESYHTVMPLLPISGADAFLEESCETLDAHFSDVWKYICANAPSRRTVLYEHALINFAYDGCAYVLGERVYLTPKERRTYLENLLQAVDCGELELIILADNNPILPVSEISCSIYMNHTDMFSFCHNCSNDEVIFSSDELLLNAYRQFLRRLIDSNPQHLTGSALTDFIRRCAQQTME